MYFYYSIVQPKQEFSHVENPAKIIENIEVEYLCELQQVRPSERADVKWKIGDGEENTSTTKEIEDMDNNLFRIKAFYRVTFGREDHLKTVSCNIYWDGIFVFSKSHENINVFCKFSLYGALEGT